MTHTASSPSMPALCFGANFPTHNGERTGMSVTLRGEARKCTSTPVTAKGLTRIFLSHRKHEKMHFIATLKLPPLNHDNENVVLWPKSSTPHSEKACAKDHSYATVACLFVPYSTACLLYAAICMSCRQPLSNHRIAAATLASKKMKAAPIFWLLHSFSHILCFSILMEHWGSYRGLFDQSRGRTRSKCVPTHCVIWQWWVLLHKWQEHLQTLALHLTLQESALDSHVALALQSMV